MTYLVPVVEEEVGPVLGHGGPDVGDVVPDLGRVLEQCFREGSEEPTP